MKVVHVIRSMDPAAGGPPVVAARLGAAQALMGHEVVIVAYDEPGATDRMTKSYAGAPGFDRVRMVSIPRGGRAERLLARGARRVLKHEVPGAGAVHLHGVWDPILLAAASAARQGGVPYALTPHGMLDPWSLGQTLSKQIKKRAALALAYRAMLNRAGFIHALNADEARLLEPLRLRAPRQVFPNGIFIEEFASLPAPGSFRQARPELGNDPFVLFLSRLHFKKGLDYLVEAFALLRTRHPRVRLVIAGPDDGYRATLESLIARQNAADRVHLVGPLYGPEKLSALVDASVFCLPSRQEGFSMAITEAMACRLPVVVSDQCHFPEVAEVGAGRVVRCDPKGVAAALEEVFSDETARRRMGEAGRRLVEERFTWARIAAGMVEAYQRAGSSSASG
ncbi:MAG TPA: hypothetical protein DEB06_10330 [Phycisphaerales bacterium]|nr:hypothetical protein [Phycisphaerales bacterium]